MTPGQLDSTSLKASAAVKLFTKGAVWVGMLLNTSKEQVSCIGDGGCDGGELTRWAGVHVTSLRRAIELSKEWLTNGCHCDLSSTLPFLDGTIVEFCKQSRAKEPWVALRSAWTIILILGISANSCSDAGIRVDGIKTSKSTVDLNRSSEDL